MSRTDFYRLKDLIADAQDEFYGDAEDWQPAYMGISPELDKVVISDDICQIPVGWHLEQACIDAWVIASNYFDFRI